MILALGKGPGEGKDHFRFGILQERADNLIHGIILDLRLVRRVNTPITGAEQHHSTRRAG